MKFDSSFLVRTTQLTRSEWICVCPTLSLKAFAPTRQESLKAMEAKLGNYLNTQGVYYLNTIGRSPDGVCCPEGLLELPLDIWKCKLDKRMCELQAWISVSDKDQFIASCHAPAERKESIHRIVTEGVYKGVHHKPGRYLCPICKGKPDTRYRYPWELTPLSHLVDIDDRDFRVALIENGIDTSVVYGSLCPDCFVQVISIVKPDLVSELESIQLGFSNEPFPSSESNGSCLESKKPPRDFVTPLLESPDSDWHLGLALASLYGQEEFTPDFGDALTLAGDWLGLTDEEVTDICNDEDESRCEELHKIADSVAWRAGWAVLCGGLEALLKRGWRLPK